MITKTLKLETKHFGQKWVVHGKSGSGKSYSVRVVVEEGLKLGVTFIVIDPQGAYGNLPGFQYLDAKKVTNPGNLGILLAKAPRNTVIQTKRMTSPEQNDFLDKFLKGYRAHGMRGIRMIVIDEAHKFAPEYEKTASREEVLAMSQENRSDGLGLMSVEQRPARISKTIISQADVLVVHRLTSYRDLKAVEPYLDNPDDLNKIKNLKTGEAYVFGLTDEPVIEQVREAETEHTGNSPEALLTEDHATFHQHLRKVYSGRNKAMSDNVDTKNEPIKGVVPSMDGFMDLVAIGAKVSLGLGVAAFAGAFASRLPFRLPYVSNRTIGAGVSMLGLYAGYRLLNKGGAASGVRGFAADVMKYAAAGAAVHTAGSLAFDLLNAFNVKIPNFVTFGLNAATGAMPMAIEGPASDGAAGGSETPDLNTQFA